ncbi:MAG: TauD/TfdA family dioxygenase [Ilumatobacteraceae bacterium]
MTELVIDDQGDRMTVSVSVSVSVSGTGSSSTHNGDTTTIELPALWLRERSPGPDAVDAVTAQRLYNPHLLPVELFVVRAESIADGQLQVEFSDGHTATFDPSRLLADVTLTDGLPVREHWTAATLDLPVHDWLAFDDPSIELAALTDFLRYGVIVIENLPTEPGSLLLVAERFGYVRDTNFGPVFEVLNIPDSNDLAYRSIALGAHTDNPYRTPPPGIQLLHCLVNETTGGASTLVDGLAVIDQLDREQPNAVELLATTAVRYRFRDETTDIVSVRPIVDRDFDGTVTGLRYSPKLDELPVLPVGEMQRFQAARVRLAQLLDDDEFVLRFTLQAGQLMMFDNSRVLHGRTSFDPNEGNRHLQGCYIDLDGPQATLRMLARQVAGTSGVAR